MNRALAYLTFCTWRNRIRVRLGRLRNPRYGIGLIIGLGYLYLVFFRRRAPRVGLLALLSRVREPVELAAAVLLFLFAAIIWVWPTESRPALAFTRAEVQFLFPAPIKRTQLVRYKVLRSILGAFLGSALMTVFLRPGSLANGWMFLLGILLIMAILNLHLTGVSLSRESLAKHGAAGLARQWLPVAVVSGAVVVLAATVAVHAGALASLGFRDVLKELERLGTTGAAGVILWPFRALARLPLSPSPGAFARGLPAVLAILALNYLWVMRTDAAFEEASADRAEKIARRREAGRTAVLRGKVLSTPFPLSPEGRPETAIVWKNLIPLGRFFSVRGLIRVLVLLLVVTVVATRTHAGGGILSIVAPFCLFVAAGTLVLGPQMLRNDLRQDLTQLATLKSWPLRGAALVRGEIAGPAVVLSVLVWVLLLVAAALSSRVSFLRELPPMARASYTVALMLATPGLLLAQLLVQNGIAVLFPSWVAIGRSRSRGVDVMGQRMLMMAGMLLALVLAVLPAALTGGALGLVIYLLTRHIFVFLPAVLAAAVLLAEGLVGTEILGRLFERTEIREVEPEE